MEEFFRFTCHRLAEVAVAVPEPAVTVEVGLGLCWHFGFVRDLVVSLQYS